MQIRVNSQALVTELRLLNKIVPSKPSIAVLGHVLLNAAERLTFYATDLEVGLVTACAATIAVPGRVALPAAHLLAMVEQFPNDDVSIVHDKKHVTVKCGGFKSRLQAYSADEFPAIPEVEGDTSRIDATAFHQLIERTRYAVNSSNAKHVLQGTLLTLQGTTAAMAATDGKRLALATALKSGADGLVIVPAKTLDRVVEHDAEVIDLTIGPRHLFFTIGERLLISRTFEGKFPSYEQIIPRANDKVVTVGKAALTAALRRVRLASAESRAVYIELKADTITLSATSAEVGDADEAVVCAYTGDALKACVNGDYLLDFLVAASGQSIAIAFKDANTQILLTDGADHIGVIMLMR